MEQISFIPGRVRLKNPILFKNIVLAEHLNMCIDNINGVKYCCISHHTTSILVEYDPTKTTSSNIQKCIDDALLSEERRKLEILPAYAEYKNTIIKRDKAKRNLMIFGTIYAILKIKHCFWGKHSISENLKVLQFASIVTIIGAYPIVRKIYEKFSKKLPVDADTLLAFAAMSMTFLRESAKGMMVLLVKELNDYVRFSAEVENLRELNLWRNKNDRLVMPIESGEEIPRSAESIKDMNIFQKLNKYQNLVTQISFGAGMIRYLISGNLTEVLSLMLSLSPSASKTAVNSGISNYASLLHKKKIFLKRQYVFEKIVNTTHIMLSESIPSTDIGKIDMNRLMQSLNKRGIENIRAFARKNLSESSIFMMVGDGENDIDAMQNADISVSFAKTEFDIVKLNSDCIIFEDNVEKLDELLYLSMDAYRKINNTINFSRAFNAFFGILAFLGYLDPFQAKSFNTINSLIVLLLNKRIEFLKMPRKYS